MMLYVKKLRKCPYHQWLKKEGKEDHEEKFQISAPSLCTLLYKNASCSIAAGTRNSLSFTTSSWLPGCWETVLLGTMHRFSCSFTSLAPLASALHPLHQAHENVYLIEVIVGGYASTYPFLLQTLTPDSTLTFYLLFPSLLPRKVSDKGRRAQPFSATTWGPWICLIYPRIEQKLEREGGQIMEAGSRGKKGRRLSALSSSPNRLLMPSGPVTASLPLFLPQSYSSSIFPLSSGGCILSLASHSPTLPEGSVFKYLWQEQWIVGVSQHLSTLIKIGKKSLQAEELLFQKLFCVRTGCHEDVRNNFQVCHSQITFGVGGRWPVQWL